MSATGLSDPIRCPVTGNTGIDCVTQFGVFFGGNPNLKPEKSEQATAGHRVRAHQRLLGVGRLLQDPPEQRHHQRHPDRRPSWATSGTYGYLVTRGPVDPNFPNLPGPILHIEQGYINLGSTHIEGIDVETHYKFPQMSWGRVRFDMSGTYYRRYDFQNLDGTYSGFVGTAFGSAVIGVIPRWKHYAMLSLDRGPWSLSLANNYQSSYTDWQTDLNGNLRTVSSMSLWDVQGQYSGLQAPHPHARRQERARHQPAEDEPAEHVPGRATIRRSTTPAPASCTAW